MSARRLLCRMLKFASCITLVASSLVATNAHAQERVLDDFSDLTAWKISATDDVKSALRSVDGPHGKAMCIDFDFGKVTGYVSASRKLPIDYPARYEFTLGIKGDALPNALQFKLVDASGENVWWSQRPDYKFPTEWQVLKLRQRQIDFAWGPTADRSLKHTEVAEFVIASGSGGGKGTACFDRLAMRELPPDDAPPGPAVRKTGGALSADFDRLREFGAVVLRWKAGAAPARYDI
jgi:hypothetical protein